MSAGTQNLKLAKDRFRKGGIIAYPTESCFGLGCDPRNYRAVQRLLRLKKRPQSMGLILIAADLAALRNWMADISPRLKSRIAENGARPSTWLVPPGRLARRYLTGRHNTLAIRIIRHPVAARLCQALASPLISTSANLTGNKSCTSAREVLSAFGTKAFVVKGRIGKNKRPSTIRDILSDKVVR